MSNGILQDQAVSNLLNQLTDAITYADQYVDNTNMMYRLIHTPKPSGKIGQALYRVLCAITQHFAHPISDLVSTPSIERVYLQLNGLAVLLGGDTQEMIYTIVLMQPGATVREIHQYAQKRYHSPIALTTVATVANRLHEKGILRRETDPTRRKIEYAYTAAISYDDLVAQSIRATIRKLYTTFPIETAAVCLEHLQLIGVSTDA